MTLPTHSPDPDYGPSRGLASLIASNSIWNVTAFVVSLLITFITTPLYIHRLGEDSYGVLVLVLSILRPLGLLDFGIGPATIKYVAESESRKDRSQSIRYVRSTFLFNTLIGVAGACVILALSETLSRNVFKIPIQDQQIAQISFGWVALRWLAMQVGNTFSSIPVALRQYKVYSIGAMLASTSIDIAGLLALYVGGNLVAITQAEALTACAIVAGWALIGMRLLPQLGILPRWHSSAFLKTFRFGFWQMLSNIGAIFAHETERALLGILVSAAAVGFYNIAWSLHVATYSLIYALGQVLFPTFSHLHGRGEREQASRIILQAMWSLGILSVGLYVPLYVFSHDLLTLWVGAEMAGFSVGILRILALAGMIASFFIVPNFYLMGIGKTGWLAWEAFMQGAITIAVSLILIPHLGLQGAAWGVLASTFAHVTFIYLTWRRLLSEWIAGRIFFPMLLGFLLAGVGIALVLDWLRAGLYWQPNWLSFIAVYGLGAATTMMGVLLVQKCLPGSAARWQESKQLILHLIPRLKVFLT